MTKGRPTEKTKSQRSAPSKPTRQERRRAARNDARARQTVETSYPLSSGNAIASPLTVATSYARQDVLALVALGLLVVVSYLPAMLWGGFVWDDNIFTNAESVRDISGLWQIWFSPGAIENEAHYWPLVYTTFWLEHKLWGFDPTGYHIVNVLLHLANVLLLWHLLRRLAVPGAWMVAAVFAVHPLHVESVAWVIERKDVLSGLFFLAAVLAWMRFVEQPSRGWYAGSLVLYVAGMLSKSIVVTLPVSLLIWHWWKQGRVTSTDLLRLVPFGVVGLVIAVGDLSFYRSVDAGALGYSLTERMLIAARALWFYMGKLLWPSDLAVIYPLWDIHVADPLAWRYPLAAVALTVSLWYFRPQFGRGPLAGVLFFAVILSPVLGFVDHEYMEYAFVADRFQYLAGIGIMAVVIGAIAYGVRCLSSLWHKGALGVAGMVLAVLGVLTWRQASIYRDDETLNRHIIALNPQARNAHLGLGVALYKQARYEEALEAIRVAVEQTPDFSKAHVNLSAILYELGRYEEALEAIRVAVEQTPDFSEAHANLGAILHELGRHEEAETHLRRAIALNPQIQGGHLGLGVALYEQERYEEALEAIRVAVEQTPDFSEAHANLGAILHELGRYEEAETHLSRALALKPQEVALSQKLAEMFMQKARYKEAIDVLAQAAALDPASPQAAELHFLMGMASEESGQPEAAYYMHALEIDPHHTKAIRRLAYLRFDQQRYDEALELFQRLIDIDPSDAVSHGNMGVVLYYLGRSDEALAHFDHAHALDPTLEDVQANRKAVLKAMEENLE